jgi:YVTN family beta-propeller protein
MGESPQANDEAEFIAGRGPLVFTRRALLSGAVLAATGCRRREAFSGYAFVANRDGGAIAAVDMGAFAVARHIRVDGAPTAVDADQHTLRVYALTPENGHLHEIRADRLALTRTIAAGNQAVAMRRTPGFVYVLCADPPRVAAISTDTFRIAWSANLPAPPVDFDLSPDGQFLAISYGTHNAVQLLPIATRRLRALLNCSGETGAVRFQKDSAQLIVAGLSERMLYVFLTATGQLVTKLPLAVRPEHFCFNDDGGQLFITGEGMDVVVVVYPFYTPQIAETVLAGRAPGAMAASPSRLFVANSKSSDVSILNIDQRKVIAVAPAGAHPGFIAITPDDQYALVLNEDSGDIAVLWVPGITRSHARTAPLLTMIPVGSRPVSAAIVAI